jgi:tetratricopeptide (TPR) repeat protein
MAKLIVTNILIFTALFAELVFPAQWDDNYDAAIKKAVQFQSPVLLYFYAPGDEGSDQFELIINAGYLDFLERSFDISKIDISSDQNAKFAQNIGLNQIPMFLLEDFDAKRKTRLKPVFIEPMNILRDLFEIYSTAAAGFLKENDNESAYAAYSIIEGLPDEMGEKVSASLKELEPRIKKKKTLRSANEDISKAETYFKTAMDNLKNSRYEKAYLYFEKVIELSPGSELAKKALTEKEKIRDKIDRSVILK